MRFEIQKHFRCITSDAQDILSGGFLNIDATNIPIDNQHAQLPFINGLENYINVKSNRSFKSLHGQHNSTESPLSVNIFNKLFVMEKSFSIVVICNAPAAVPTSTQDDLPRGNKWIARSPA